MPSANGTLSRSEIALVRRWIRTRQITRTCLTCGGDEWSIWKRLVTLPGHDAKAETLSAHRYAVTVECASCGHLRFFSARSLGLAAEQPAEQSKVRRNVH